jgi:hypothetical protein
VNRSRNELAFTVVDLDSPATEAVRQKIAAIPGVLMTRIV